jgi:hypothetical protein
MQQKLDGVGALVVAEQYRRFSVGEDERLAPRVVPLAGPVEFLDGGAILTATDPLIAIAELEVRDAGVALDGVHRLVQLFDVQSVERLGVLGSHDVLLGSDGFGRRPPSAAQGRKGDGLLT